MRDLTELVGSTGLIVSPAPREIARPLNIPVAFIISALCLRLQLLPSGRMDELFVL